MWGYAIFAFLVAPFFMDSERAAGVAVEKWARLAPYFLLWMPIAWAISRIFVNVLPRNPEDGREMYLVSSGDAGVHLAAIAVLLLLNLHRSRAGQEEADSVPLSHEWILWVLWAAGMFTIASDGRAALVTVLAALGVAAFRRPIRIGGKLLLVGSIAIVLMMATVVANLSLALGHEGKRSISASQMIDNLQSLTGGGRQDLESTAQWRLVWWKKIINYTVYGPYFWTGKGFGVQLAHDDGIGVRRTVRSPHNGHLTILAREGVPGLVIWLVLQSAFGIGMLRAHLRARRMKDGWWERVNLWILTYWLSFLVNATFGVYIEAPTGGIWFWCVFGMGMAAMELQRQKYGRRTPAYEIAARGRGPAFAVRPSGLAGVPSLSTRQRFS
jgi:O-antigen ligase